MSNIELFKAKAPPVNSDLFRRFNEQEANIREAQTVPSLLPGGKRWTVKMNGKETLIQQKVDGELVPAAVLKGVVIGYNPDRSRAYYKGSYDKDNVSAPDCWSNDGRTPDKSVENPPCASCASCPMAAKGSKVDDRGKATTACQQQKFLAVLPYAGKIWEQPLRLKLSITSIYDGMSPDLAKEGWFAWDQYVSFLRGIGIMNTALVITKMKFDPNVEYPKILFAADDYCNAEQLQFLADLKAKKADEITALTSREWTPAGGDGVRVDDAPRIARHEPAPVVDDSAAKAAAEAAKKAAADKKAEAAAAKKRKAEEAAKAAQAAAEAAAKAAAEASDDGEIVLDGEIVDAAAEAGDPPFVVDEPKAAPAGNGGIPDDLAALVGDWAKTS